VIVARIDAGLHASIDDLRPLTYADGGSAADDRPGHVRAASAVRRVGSRLVIVQDDVNALAFHDEASDETQALLLPRGPGGRRVFDDVIGNKKGKLDLEACAALPGGRLVAFGSGSSPMRETLVVLGEAVEPRVHDARALYGMLRAHAGFAGSELNVEGAVVAGGVLVLFQRGNGAARGGLEPVNAIGTLDLAAFLRFLDEAGPTPELLSVARVELGEIEGAKLGFTDATLTADGRIAVLACAEASPDAVRDGPVLGCQVGLLDHAELRMTDVLDAHGRRTTLKLEGLEQRPDSPLSFDVVADTDRPEAPALLGHLHLHEP
jgi:hypothetical protein